MLSLHTNASALSTQSSVGGTQKELTTSLTRLGTGYRVNSAMDDAAGLQIAVRLEAQTRGMSVAQKNTQNGISMMQTAEGAFTELTNVLLRMRDLSLEAFTASTTADDKSALQAEFNALGLELGNIMRSTSFGGQYLFSDGVRTDGIGGLLSGTISFQIGASADETMAMNTLPSLASLGNWLSPLVVPNALLMGPTDAGLIDGLATTLDFAGVVRSQLGAASNRLEHVYNNLGNMQVNTAASRGRILDVDYAAETANSTSKQLLMQAGTSALTTSKSLSQLVISLMQ
jgi:flagellin